MWFASRTTPLGVTLYVGVMHLELLKLTVIAYQSRILSLMFLAHWICNEVALSRVF
jgi:hypothetical protein